MKETRHGESRVALIPNDVLLLVENGYHVNVEHNAGLTAGYDNEEYKLAGAHIINFNVGNKHSHDTELKHLLSNALILRVKRANRQREQWENDYFSNKTIMMGFLDPFDKDHKHISEWLDSGITTFSLDQLQLPRNDPKNTLAAMSKIAGNLAFKDALEHYSNNEKPEVIIIGTGAAAFSAAKSAESKGFSVCMFGRSEKYRKQIVSSNIAYKLLPKTDNTNAQVEYIRSYLEAPGIVITAARAAGQKAPILIDRKSLSIMHPSSIIVDLSADGGNVEGSVPDHIIRTEQGVTIINISGYPKKNPKLASELYSNAVRLEFLIQQTKSHC